MKTIFSSIILLLFAINICSSTAFSQTFEWTWLKGDTSIPYYGNYGVKGTPSPNNKPGARYGGVTWTDQLGNFWLFGGYGYSSLDYGLLNDLWKYDVSIGQWIYLKGDTAVLQTYTTNSQGIEGIYGSQGTSSPTNTPGSRTGSVAWKDAVGDLWLFGGYGYGNQHFSRGNLNDLWKYNIASNEWTWMKGEDQINGNAVYGTQGVSSGSNLPGAKEKSIGWTDGNGNLWMFGGGRQSGNGDISNELWKYNPLNNQWTWMKGSSSSGTKNVYGIKGVSSSSSTPGASSFVNGFTDASGNIWLFSTVLWQYNSSTNQWTWIKGDTLVQNGVYGSQGTPSMANLPGVRQGSVTWSDASGNLWLFGGNGYSAGYFNDLWRYNILSNQWTWVKGDSVRNSQGVYGVQGTSNTYNKPKCRTYGMGWLDNGGEMWLFGGNSYESSGLSDEKNDIWKYTPTTNNWTWIKGDSVQSVNDKNIYGSKGVPSLTNKPGARIGSALWADNNANLWLFGGGSDLSSINYNDLWKYSSSTSQWTWIAGDSSINNTSTYGIRNIPSNSNKPGSRRGCIRWIDATGNLWLFGGYRISAVGDSYFNDLWKFNPTTSLWTWISGDSSVNSIPNYGLITIPSAINKPGARSNAVSWMDSLGNLWLWGGYGYANNGLGYLNDLWKYNPTTNEWSWMKGYTENNNYAVYGTKGISSPTNKPGSMEESNSWTDKSGNFWLFGGVGYGSSIGGPDTRLKDLWKYNISTNEWTWVNTPTTNSSGFTKPTSESIGWTDKSGNLWSFGGYYKQYEWDPEANGNVLLYDISYGDWQYKMGSNKSAKFSYQTGNRAGARRNAAVCQDTLGNMWMFGGYGYATKGHGLLNDLWQGKVVSTTVPVYLVSFTGEFQNTLVNLQWRVDNEQNFSHYEVERSSNGTKFDKAGSVIAINSTSYQFDDYISELKVQKIFYRLKLVDRDGKYSYSHIIDIKLPSTDNKMVIYPNPTKSSFQVQFTKVFTSKSEIQIADVTGQIVLKRMYDGGVNSMRLSVSKLIQGKYTVKVINGNDIYLGTLVVLK